MDTEQETMTSRLNAIDIKFAYGIGGLVVMMFLSGNGLVSAQHVLQLLSGK